MSERAALERWQINPARPVVAGLLLVGIGFVGLVVWAAMAPLDSAISVNGAVAIKSNRQVAQHPEGGVIEELFVEDGDRVDKGAPLLQLEDTRAKAIYRIYKQQLHAALATEARLRAERLGADAITFPEELEEVTDKESRRVIDGQRELFRARRESLESQVEVLESRIEQFREQIAGLKAQQEARTRQVNLLTDELQGLRKLEASGNVPRNYVLERERRLAEFEGDEGKYRSQVAEVRQGISEARLQIEQLKTEFRERVETQLQEIRSRVADLRERLVAAETTLDRTTLRAPAAGVIYAMRLHTPGGVVKPGEDILYIVPEGDDLIINGRLRPTDVEEVHVGQKTTVRFPGLSFRETPMIDGEVRYVSPDVQTDTESGENYYEVRVRVQPEELAKLGEVRLQPGMPASMLIKTGERTFLEYMLDPFQAMLDRAFTEK